MELVPAEPADDEAERLRRAGRRLRDWRRTQVPPLSREAFAKRADVSIGCVQSFEAGTRTTTPAKIARMVAVLGVTADQIFSEEDFPDPRAVTLLRTHPLLRDLRPEDFRIAHAYHHAGAEAKYAIKALFGSAVSEEIRERVAHVLEQLLRFHEAMLPEFEAFLAALAAKDPAQLAAAPPPLHQSTLNRR